MPVKRCDIPRSRLLEVTLELLRNRPINKTLDKISADTGLGTDWLSTFQNERAISPSVNHVECLYRYLTGKHLKI